METKRVRSKIWMLSTKDKSEVVLHESGKLGYLARLSLNMDWEFVEKDWTNQHLYFTTDQEIKERDWYFDGIDLVHKKSKYNKDLVDGNKQAKKIVATTDKSLGLPEPSQAFIQKYCELGGIDEVDIELKSSDLDYFFGDLKVDPIHNTVTIHSIKDSWNREEMFQLMDNYQNYLIETDRTVKSFEEWFNS